MGDICASLGTDYRMRPDTSLIQVFPGKTIKLGRITRQRLPVRAWQRTSPSQPACLIQLVNGVLVIAHAGAAHHSRTEICENIHADMRIATSAASAILSSHRSSQADGLALGAL
jgi:hypothetical protein